MYIQNQKPLVRLAMNKRDRTQINKRGEIPVFLQIPDKVKAGIRDHLPLMEDIVHINLKICS